MKTILANFKTPALIGFLLTLPFMILELVNRWKYHETFPIHIFAVLWLLSTIFFLALVSVIKNLRTGEKSSINLFKFVITSLFMLLVSFIWLTILMDQINCFLGVPNCD